MQRMVIKEESNGLVQFDRTAMEGRQGEEAYYGLAISPVGVPSATGGERDSCGFAGRFAGFQDVDVEADRCRFFRCGPRRSAAQGFFRRVAELFPGDDLLLYSVLKLKKRYGRDGDFLR
jgi:hypothetical protein